MRPRSHNISARPLLLLFFCFAASSFSCAQKSPDLLQKLAPGIDIFGGYSYLRVDSPSFGYANYSNLEGFDVAITAPHLYEGLGFAVNASGDYTSGLKVYNFLIGPQYSYERGKTRFYGNILFGKAETKVDVQELYRNEATSVGRALTFGGGVEMKIRPKIAIRVIDAEYISSKTFSGTQSNIRVSTGVVYHFGKK